MQRTQPIGGPVAYTQGNILQTAAHQAIANPVNCAATMGAGLALQFARAYPEILPPYRKACHDGDLRPGRVQILTLKRQTNPLYVVNFPTKDHWNSRSRLEWISSGLDAMYPALEDLGITSVALPALGAGYGRLPWPQVRDAVERAASAHPKVLTTVILPLPRP